MKFISFFIFSLTIFYFKDSISMKKILFFIAAFVTQLSNAAYKPVSTSQTMTATISYAGSSVTFDEARTRNQYPAPMTDTVYKLTTVPKYLNDGLNQFFANAAASNGGTFLSGKLNGDVGLTFTPSPGGSILFNLTAGSYTFQTKFTGTRYGVIDYTCINTTTISNLSVTGAYGSDTGAIENKTGVTGSVSTSTDCDSNLSWILPFIGDYLINKYADQANAELITKINAGMAQAKDILYIGKDKDLLSGLNRLIPIDKSIKLPNGSSFAIGLYVRDNLTYLAKNGQVSIKFGSGPQWPMSLNTYGKSSYSGDYITLSITSPSVSFSVKATETYYMDWIWDNTCIGPRGVKYSCGEP